MMEYCPSNVSLFDIWVDHGTSQCFMDTITSSVLGVYLAFFGTIQLWMYWKYGTPLPLNSLSRSPLYYAQLFLLYFLSVLAIVRFLFKTFVIYHQYYGYMVVSTYIYIVVFPYSAYIIHIERHHILPAVPARGHGLVLLIFWTILFVAENLVFVNLKRNDWWFHMDSFESKIEMALFITRYACCLCIFVLGLRAPGIMTSRDYFSLSEPARRTDADPSERDRLTEESTWKNFFTKVKVLLPFLWPRKSINLQLRVILCFMLIFIGRGLNVLTPVLTKSIVNSLPDSFRWDLVVYCVLVKYLQGGGAGSMGLINNMRSLLWIKVQQYTTRETEVKVFQHLHSLSLRWHLSRKTGEVLRIMDRGTESINSILSIVLFQIAPAILDISVAVIYFIFAYDLWFALIVFSTMILYLITTILITEWRTKFRRRMNLADNNARAQSVDSLLNYETVKYYGCEDYEVNNYRESIFIYQVEEWKNNFTLWLLNSAQNLIINAGLLLGSVLCIYYVAVLHKLTVGDYVLFSTYILQLYVPLNWFGTFYRQIQNSFVDMENMFNLLHEEPEVQDALNAPAIKITKGTIEFRNVSFSYVPDKMVLRNVSFVVQPGKTVALVGPSGSGKTTIIRLLFRFYDVNSGSITIDDQNIKLVKQSSLRKSIGVVPQDTVLFNNTIRYNIRYGNVDSSDSDVVAAAMGADIHERILTFPDLYETQVGERGLKVSGGEKQRVAIARTILKNPMIILLDEATSALDTNTERNIQASLAKICANKTTIIVAHRLSTIIHADEILVLKDGEICERGNHRSLINSNSLYASMWQQQLKNDVTGNEDPSAATSSTAESC